MSFYWNRFFNIQSEMLLYFSTTVMSSWNPISIMLLNQYFIVQLIHWVLSNSTNGTCSPIQHIILKNRLIKLSHVLKTLMFYSNTERTCIFFKSREYYNKLVNNSIKIERGSHVDSNLYTELTVKKCHTIIHELFNFHSL